jgi:hypothetical protein
MYVVTGATGPQGHADEVQSDTHAGREQNESVKRAPASKNGLR